MSDILTIVLVVVLIALSINVVLDTDLKDRGDVFISLLIVLFLGMFMCILLSYTFNNTEQELQSNRLLEDYQKRQTTCGTD